MSLLFAVLAAVVLGSQLVILWSAAAGRTPASSPTRSARWAEVAWVVLPALVLILVLLATWRAVGAVTTVGTGVNA